MRNGLVVAICICPSAGAPMQSVREVEAVAGQGLVGDRYSTGEGSFNKGRQGKRQVTVINGMFFPGSGFEFVESRRNIVTMDVELMDLLGKEFEIGGARFRGVKYSDPCTRPSKLSGNSRSFREAFFDRGGIVADVITSGTVHVGGLVIPPPKDY